MTWQTLKKEQRVSLITEQWDKDCSASTLAAVLSQQTGSKVTRHAIIGIYTRNPGLQFSHPLGGAGVIGKRQLRNEDGTKLLRQHATHRKTRRQRMAETINSIPVEPRKALKLRLPEAFVAYDAASRHVPLWELVLNQCHWSVNDPAPGERHLFCGQETAASEHYCAHHLARSTPQRKPTDD